MIVVGRNSEGALVIQMLGEHATEEARMLAGALIRCTPLGETDYVGSDGQRVVVCVTGSSEVRDGS